MTEDDHDLSALSRGQLEGMLRYLARHLEETSDSTADEWLDEARRRHSDAGNA